MKLVSGLLPSEGIQNCLLSRRWQRVSHLSHPQFLSLIYSWTLTILLLNHQLLVDEERTNAQCSSQLLLVYFVRILVWKDNCQNHLSSRRQNAVMIGDELSQHSVTESGNVNQKAQTMCLQCEGLSNVARQTFPKSPCYITYSLKKT